MMKALTCHSRRRDWVETGSPAGQWTGKRVKLTKSTEAHHKLATSYWNLPSCRAAKSSALLWQPVRAELPACPSVHWLHNAWRDTRSFVGTHASVTCHTPLDLLPDSSLAGNGRARIVQLPLWPPPHTCLCLCVCVCWVFISFPRLWFWAACCLLTTLCSQLAICWFDWWPTPRDLPIVNSMQRQQRINCCCRCCC